MSLKIYKLHKSPTRICRSGVEEVHVTKAVRSTVEAEGIEETEDYIDWKSVDLTKPDLPDDLEQLAKKVKVVQEELVISQGREELLMARLSLPSEFFCDGKKQ